jgi:uncharacterized alpha-E superfamily protein
MLEDIFQNLIHLSSLTGLAFENLSRESGWYFIEIGKRLERALNLIRVMQNLINLNLQYDKNALESLLNFNDIRITYKRRYRYKMELEPVFDILLFDDSNPRSLTFQINELYENIKFLPNKDPKKIYPEDRQVLEIYTAFKLKDMSMFLNNGNLTEQEFLEWITDLQMKLRNLSSIVAERYFNYTENQRFLGESFSA